MDKTASIINYSEFLNGLRIFIKLTGLKEDPLEHRWVRDEFDLTTALSYIPYFVKQTARFTADRMYVKQPYDYVEDVTKDIQECLIIGKEPKDSALLRKKHLMMYHLVVVPAIQILYQLPTKQYAIQHVDEIINTLHNMVMTHDIYTNYEDAIVAKLQVQRIIAHRTELEAKVKSSRSKKIKVDQHDLILQ